MVSRIIISIIVGIVTAFLFYLVGTLLAPFAGVIASILLNVSYPAGIIAALLYFFGYSHHATHPIL
jgi:lipopolysaccharide export LptBFGC system permease protein LptF